MTPSTDAPVGMIDQAYAAALEPTLWQDFTLSVSEHFRDGSTILWHANQIAASHRYEAKVLRAFEDRFAAINPWMPKKSTCPWERCIGRRSCIQRMTWSRASFTPISWPRNDLGESCRI